jgi:hypothetical protein
MEPVPYNFGTTPDNREFAAINQLMVKYLKFKETSYLDPDNHPKE